MTAIFPAHLGRGYVLGSYSQRRRPHVRDFETDSGMILRSKMPGSALTEVGFTCHYTADQYDDLEAFYTVDCAEGATAFYMPHPVSKAMRTFHWAEAPQIQHYRGAAFAVTLSLLME